MVKKGKKDDDLEKNDAKENEDINLSFLDVNNINNIIENIKFCLDRSAKLVILFVTYDQPTY